MLKISVITITYNSAQTVEQTIQSVLNQSYKNVEYIVVDGESTDATFSIIEKYKNKISNIISEKDNGLYDALNKGIALATGDIIGILHSDDFFVDNNVLQHYANLFTSTNADAVYSDLYYVDKTNTNNITRKWKSGNYKPNSFLFGWMPPHPTFFVKRELYKKYGNFNLQLTTAADYELMLRFIHKHKIFLAYLPQYSIKMRIGGKSNITIKSRLNANMEDRKAWEINNLKPYFFTLFLKPLRKVLQFL